MKENKKFKSRDVKRADRTGRPSKLDDAIIKNISNAIMLGLNYMRTAELVGISDHCFLDWRKIGEQDYNKGENSLYSKLFLAIKKAEAQGIASRLARINEAEKEHWQAGAWWLERRYPDEWGRKERVEMGGTVKIESILGALPADIAAEVGKILIKQISEGSDTEGGE